MKTTPEIRRRRLIQWLVLPVVLVTIALGWKYPVLGFSAPIVMAMGLFGSFFRGRYVCGNLCPRGGFFDRMIAPLNRRRHIPPFFRSMTFRWIIFAALMGFMGWRVAQNPGDWEHWGRVFWLMCVITTGVGMVLGLLVQPRTWCSFCPMGTLQRTIGGHKGQLRIDAKLCIECRACEKICPMNIPIVSYKATGIVADRDCIKCGECVGVCPVHALSWPDACPRA